MDVIARSLETFNAGDVDAMPACLTDDASHHGNEGNIRTGKAGFAAFCAHMNRCYRETPTDMVILRDATGTRAAAEYVVNGTCRESDRGPPKARGQTCRLPAGPFFEPRDGHIARTATCCNLADRVRQVRP